MRKKLVVVLAGLSAQATAQAHVPNDVIDGCEMYGANMGIMWQAVHEKHMTLEQLNAGVDRVINKQFYYKSLSEQQAVLDNARYKGATATTVAVVETAECIRRRS